MGQELMGHMSHQAKKLNEIKDGTMGQMGPLRGDLSCPIRTDSPTSTS